MNRQPNSNFCFICGRQSPVGLKMDFYSTSPSEVQATFTVPDAYQSYPGIVHGGVTAAMLDETAGRALMADGEGRFFMTLKLEIKYRCPVPTETPLCIVGRVIDLRGRRATAHSEVQLPDGQVAAEAEVLLAEMPASMLEGADLETLGWRVDDE